MKGVRTGHVELTDGQHDPELLGQTPGTQEERGKQEKLHWIVGRNCLQQEVEQGQERVAGPGNGGKVKVFRQKLRFLSFLRPA